MSSAAATYQSIREQLIALQVDVDDKTKVCEVLEQKVRNERSLLSRIESEITEEYQTTLERELRDHQAEMERLRNLSSRYMHEKKELMEFCKVQLGAIKDDETSVQDQARRLHREADETLELERKTFRSGHEERLQKFLASKAGEHREQTGKALQPEFARLQLMHERELSEVETNAKSDERKMREAMQTRLEELVREEKLAFSEEQRGLVRSRSDAVSAELQAADREHRMRIHALQSDLEKDLERFVTALNAKTDKERKAGQAEIRKAQEACHARMQEIRTRHLTEMQALLKDHDEQLKELRKDAEYSLKKIERKIRDEAESSGGIEGPTSWEQHLDESVRREAIAQRDKRIQSEIRSLQVESVRLERAWKAKAEEERNEIAEARNREEKESTKRQRNYTEQISELAVIREGLAQDVRILNEKVLVLASELLEGRREIEVYESGIAAHRLRLKDLEGTHFSRQRDEEASNERTLESFRVRIDKLSDLLRNKEKMLEQELSHLEAAHVSEMEKLDAQVKTNVAQKDEDLELLRDAVQTEKVKIARLEKILKQSTSSESASTSTRTRHRDAFT